MSCRHNPRMTGRKILATYGKANLPDRRHPVQSRGDEAVCLRCGCTLIVHEADSKFAEPMTEIEKLEEPSCPLSSAEPDPAANL